MITEFKRFDYRINGTTLTIFNGQAAKELNLPDEGSITFFTELLEQASGQHCEPGESPVELKMMIYKLADEIKKLTDHINSLNQDIIMLTRGKDFSKYKAGDKIG